MNRGASRNAAPRVSVVLPTYDRERFLREAVESVLDQTYDNIELIVVDDHSPTPAEEVLSDVALDRVERAECVRHDRNRGANVARNTGIDTATGEYVAFLDDDDRWHSEKIERQVAALQRADDAVGVAYTGTRYEGPRGTIVETPTTEGDVTKDILAGASFGEFSTIMVRRSVIEDAGRPDEEFPSWQDREWYLRLSLHCEFESIPEPLTIRQIEHAGRIGDNYEEKRDVSYPLFLRKHRSVAARYGRRYERMFVASLTFLLGQSAATNGRHREARKYFLKAVRTYPFDASYYPYLAASIGGEATYRIAQTLAKVARETARGVRGESSAR